MSDGHDCLEYFALLCRDSCDCAGLCLETAGRYPDKRVDDGLEGINPTGLRGPRRASLEMVTTKKRTCAGQGTRYNFQIQLVTHSSLCANQSFIFLLIFIVVN